MTIERSMPAPPQDRHTPETPTNAAKYIAGIHRRRNATWCLPVLESGRADPWHYDEPEPADRTADGYRDAAEHLLAAGLLPAPFIPEMRVMWRKNQRSRELVRAITSRWEVAA